MGVIFENFVNDVKEGIQGWKMQRPLGNHHVIINVDIGVVNRWHVIISQNYCHWMKLGGCGNGTHCVCGKGRCFCELCLLCLSLATSVIVSVYAQK